jgi:hypothetical protein
MENKAPIGSKCFLRVPLQLVISLEYTNNPYPLVLITLPLVTFVMETMQPGHQGFQYPQYDCTVENRIELGVVNQGNQ